MPSITSEVISEASSLRKRRLSIHSDSESPQIRVFITCEVTNSLIADAAPSGSQGRVQGANQAQQSVARMFGPLLGALLYTFGPSLPYFAGATFVTAALFALFLPTMNKVVFENEIYS